MSTTNVFKEEYKHANVGIVKVKVEKMEGIIDDKSMDIEEGSEEGWVKVVKEKKKQGGKTKKQVHKKGNESKYKAITQSPAKLGSPSRHTSIEEFEKELETMDIYGVEEEDTKMDEDDEVKGEEKEDTNMECNKDEKGFDWQIKVGGKWVDYESDDEEDLDAISKANLKRKDTESDISTSGNTNKMEVIEEMEGEDEYELKKPEKAKEESNGKKEYENKNESNEEKKDQKQSSLGEVNSAANGKKEDQKQSSLGKARSDIRSFAEMTKMGLKPKYLKNTVRYRCHLRFEETKAELQHMKETLKTALDIAKNIDPSAQLVTLERDAPNMRSGLDIEKLDRESIINYIDWRVDRNQVKKLMIKHNQNKVGIRITFESDKSAFFNKWRAARKPFKEMKKPYYAIRLDKVQKGTRAFQLGMFIGTSYSQNLEKMQQEIEQATGIKGIEVSYQDVYQSGATEDFRDKAYKKADQFNRYTRDWFETLNRNLPRAVMAYVQDPNIIDAARDMLRSKYQKEVDGQWPRLPDGSLAKFVPLKGSKTLSQETMEQIKTRLGYHIQLNDKFVNIPINVTDIDTKYTELNNKSIRDILHELVSEKVRDLDGKCANEPLIRHVCDEWSPNPNERRYSVAVLSALAQEAEQRLKFLHEGLEMSFPEAATILRKIFKVRQEQKYAPRIAHSKNKEDEWFEGDNEERYEKIKIEGLELIQKDQLPTIAKMDSTVAADDITSNASLRTVQSTDKTPDTSVEESDEIIKLAEKNKLTVEQVRKRLAQVKVKLKFINEFKDKKELLNEILRMKHKQYNFIFKSNPLFWSSKMVADMIVEQYKEDLDSSPGNNGQ